jgi:glycosyltransferase involved in cell wall biosynthesis
LRLLSTLLSSDELYAAIQAAPADTRFIFIPYPFPTTFWGALIAPERSFLLPCLHDETYAYYNTYRYLFNQVRGVLANSHAEADLVRRLYGLPDARIHVPGEGISLMPRGEGARFRQAWGLNGTARPDLLLYVGRRDESKNIAQLLAFTREYWARRGRPLRLLLAGQGELNLPAGAGALIYDLGYLDESAKHDAYAAADLFVHPSIYESFSIVLMEAWLQGTPALVNGACAVTSDHCQRSGGGLLFHDFGSFAAALDLLLPQAQLRHALGARGRDYVLKTCNWKDVARRTAQAVLNST